ncbi:MAG: hypothetical protein JSW47_09545 [Phycisphaerales bacterium]|nr:MAG: hypothetical protein JSW47_09545 [Phycisphaerales bacterium]
MKPRELFGIVGGRTPINRKTPISHNNSSNRTSNSRVLSKTRISYRSSRIRARSKIPMNPRIPIRHNKSSRRKTKSNNSRPLLIRRHRRFSIESSASERTDNGLKELSGEKSIKTGERNDKQLGLMMTR